MELKVGTFCPLIKKDCVQMKCSWFIQVRGMNKNTGKEIDEWGCSMAWLPHLIIDGNQAQRETGAAVESFRNETVREKQKDNLYKQLEFAYNTQQKPMLIGEEKK